MTKTVRSIWNLQRAGDGGSPVKVRFFWISLLSFSAEKYIVGADGILPLSRKHIKDLKRPEYVVRGGITIFKLSSCCGTEAFLHQRRAKVQACLRPWRPLTISERVLGHFWWFVRSWRRSKMTGFRFSQYQRNIQIFSVHCLEKYRWLYLGKLFLDTIQ